MKTKFHFFHRRNVDENSAASSFSRQTLERSTGVFTISQELTHVMSMNDVYNIKIFVYLTELLIFVHNARLPEELHCVFAEPRVIARYYVYVINKHQKFYSLTTQTL